VNRMMASGIVERLNDLRKCCQVSRSWRCWRQHGYVDNASKPAIAMKDKGTAGPSPGIPPLALCGPRLCVAEGVDAFALAVHPGPASRQTIGRDLAFQRTRFATFLQRAGAAWSGCVWTITAPALPRGEEIGSPEAIFLYCSFDTVILPRSGRDAFREALPPASWVKSYEQRSR